MNLRVLNLGDGNVDTGTPMGSMVFTGMAALAQMELEIKREHVNDSNTKRRNACLDLGGRRPASTQRLQAYLTVTSLVGGPNGRTKAPAIWRGLLVVEAFA